MTNFYSCKCTDHYCVVPEKKSDPNILSKSHLVLSKMINLNFEIQ